jgi:NAD(P)H-dependent FMN reductase/GNAT superfamily N-acetyltransferase
VRLVVVPVATSGAERLADVLADAEEDQALVEAALGDPANTAYAALVDGVVVGAAVVRWRRGLTSEILYIAVAAQHRGRGLGRRLVRHLVDELSRHGPRLVVGTANSSLDNIAFYQRCGFRMDAVRRDHFGYVDPPAREFGIPMRDMIVFSHEAPEPEAWQTDEATAVDPGALAGVRFSLVPGSTRPGSSNVAVLRTIASLVPTARLYEGLAGLPALVPGDDGGGAVAALRDHLAWADVVVFCTPEYAGSLPGSLKNLLDWTVGTADLHRKPVAWINVAAPGRGDLASADLARVLGYVDAQVLEPGGLRLPAPSASVTDGTVSDPTYRRELLDAMHALGAAYSALGDQPPREAVAPGRS